MELGEDLSLSIKELRHANLDQLSELVEVCDLQVELYGGEKIDTVLNRYLFSMSCYVNAGDEPFVYSTGVNNTISDEASRFMFEHYYPGATEKDLEALIRLDGATFARVGSVRAFMNDSGYKYNALFDYKEFVDYVMGSSDGLQMYPRRLVMHTDDDVSALVEERITGGMPRPLQLILAAEIIAGLSAIHRQYHEPIFKNVIDGFDLSDQELQIAVALVGRINNRSSQSVANFVVGDSALLQKFCDDNGDTDYDMLGGSEVLMAMLTSAFTGPAEYWQQIIANISPDTLEDLLSYETRRGIVLADIAKRPHLPQRHLAEYVTPEEIAQITRDYILQSLDSELPEYGWGTKRMCYSSTHAAVEFGVDDVPWRLKELDDYHKVITILEQTAPQDSDLDIQVQVWRGRIENIDPWLDAWFESYAKEKHNRDLDRLPVDGWSGDPSEEEYIQSWVESRKCSLDTMERIKTEVIEYLQKQKNKST